MSKNNEKEFNTKLYAVIVFAVIAVILAVLVVTTFTSKYTGFHPDTVAEYYVDNIVQQGDGYDAYKYTVLSKSEKFGNFIRENYMYELIYDGYKKGDDTDSLEGLNNEDLKSQATENDDGTLQAKLNDTMYKYYVELINTYGYDDYDSIFTNYFAKLKEVRAEVFGDTYLDDEVMFTTFEANVSTYGQYLNGTDAIYDPYDETKVLTEATKGIYDDLYGDDYSIVCKTTDVTELTDEEVTAYKTTVDASKYETYGISVDDVVAVDKCTVVATLEDGTAVATQELYTVKIGNSWYVDNTTVDTSALYIAK